MREIEEEKKGYQKQEEKPHPPDSTTGQESSDDKKVCGDYFHYENCLSDGVVVWLGGAERCRRGRW